MQSAQFQKKLNDILNCQKRFFATFAPVAILLQKYFLLNFLFLLWGPLGVGRRKFLRLPVTGSSLREVLYSMLYIGYKVTGYRNFTPKFPFFYVKFVFYFLIVFSGNTTCLPFVERARCQKQTEFIFRSSSIV